MYLHLGRDIVVSRRTIVGIFDFDISQISSQTLLKRANGQPLPENLLSF